MGVKIHGSDKKGFGYIQMINDQSQQLYSNSKRPEMVSFLPSEYTNVLEIGCNTGNFRQYASESCEYWGVEPYDKAAKIAKTKLNKVLVGLYSEVEGQLPDNNFDLIIANDVIEHMEAPWGFLQSIKNKMTKNGSLVLSIPNVRYYENLKKLLVGKDWKYEDCGVLDVTHLRFFTEKSVLRLLDENGFKIEEIRGINPKEIKKRNFIRHQFIKFIFGDDIDFLQFGVRAKIK